MTARETDAGPAPAADPAAPVPETAGGGGRPAGTGRAWLTDLVRSAAAPAICGLALIGLLAGWVAVGSGGTVSRVRIAISRATIPVRSFTAGLPAGRRAGTYLTIRSFSGHPDVLTGATSPAGRVILDPAATAGRGAGNGARLAIPAHAVVALSPFGADLTLVAAARLRIGEHVRLTLDFRDAGPIAVEAAVTAPGAP
jgi:copper(I)-binding protein